MQGPWRSIPMKRWTPKPMVETTPTMWLPELSGTKVKEVFKTEAVHNLLQLTQGPLSDKFQL